MESVAGDELLASRPFTSCREKKKKRTVQFSSGFVLKVLPRVCVQTCSSATNPFSSKDRGGLTKVHEERVVVSLRGKGAQRPFRLCRDRAGCSLVTPLSILSGGQASRRSTQVL